jgi:hypothetical protein
MQIYTIEVVQKGLKEKRKKEKQRSKQQENKTINNF